MFKIFYTLFLSLIILNSSWALNNENLEDATEEEEVNESAESESEEEDEE